MSSEKVDYGMTSEDKKLAADYDELTKKIKELDIELSKLKSRLKSNRLKEKEEADINEKIKEVKRQIKYHIFARNKISVKLYKSDDKEANN